MTTSVRLSLISLILIFGTSSKAQEWRGVTLLRSSRADLERLLGHPTNQGKYVSTYDLIDEIVDVTYSSGPPCGTGITNSWKVPSGVVVGIRLIPKKDWDLDSQVKDKDRYKKVREREASYYLNEERGVRYMIREDQNSQRETVIRVDYFPGNNEKHLKCSTLQSNSHTDVPAFETYGRVSTARRNSILDNFAIQLERDKQLKGYVVVYVKRNGRQDDALRIAKSARSYLVLKRGIEPGRVVAMIGGSRETSIVELYLIPNNWPAPVVKSEAWKTGNRRIPRQFLSVISKQICKIC